MLGAVGCVNHFSYRAQRLKESMEESQSSFIVFEGKLSSRTTMKRDDDGCCCNTSELSTVVPNEV